MAASSVAYAQPRQRYQVRTNWLWFDDRNRTDYCQLSQREQQKLGKSATKLLLEVCRLGGHEAEPYNTNYWKLAKAIGLSVAQTRSLMQRLRVAGLVEKVRHAAVFRAEQPYQYAVKIRLRPLASAYEHGQGTTIWAPKQAWLRWSAEHVGHGGRRVGAGRKPTAKIGENITVVGAETDPENSVFLSSKKESSQADTYPSAATNSTSNQVLTNQAFNQDQRIRSTLLLVISTSSSSFYKRSASGVSKSFDGEMPQMKKPPSDFTSAMTSEKRAVGVGDITTSDTSPHSPSLLSQLDAVSTSQPSSQPLARISGYNYAPRPLSPLTYTNTCPVPLDESMPRTRQVERLLWDYRLAFAEAYPGEAYNGFRQKGSLERSRYYPRLAKAAEILLHEGISPASWAYWMIQRSKKLGRTPPGIVQVFTAGLIKRWHGWWRKDHDDPWSKTPCMTQGHLEQLMRNREHYRLGYVGATNETALRWLPTWYVKIRQDEIRFGHTDPLELYPDLSRGGI